MSEVVIPEALRERISKLVTPSEAEEKKLERVETELTKKLDATFEADSENPMPQLALGGSYARGTWLKGNHDVDFFLMYPLSFSREKLETVAIRNASRALEGYTINKRYAEHPYVESFVDNVRINVVPCYAAAPGQWQSAADRSPYHTKYMQRKLDERLRLEARLFKKFVKASGVYGAELKVQGFSGYVCEVLTLKFGSFSKVLQSLSQIPSGEVISVEEYDRDLAASFKSPVVILDPVDTTRNLGSAISGRNLGKLVLECRRFLSHPSIRFFLPRKDPQVSSKLLRAKQPLLSRLIVVQFSVEPRSPDILWGELKRSSASISEKLAGHGYQVIRHSAATNERERAALLFLLSNVNAEGLAIRSGPEYFRAEEVEKYFEKNHRKALLMWVGEEGRFAAAFERNKDWENASSTLEWMLEKNNIDGIGISPRIRKELLKKHSTMTGVTALKTEKKQECLAKAILEIVSGD